MRYKSGHKAKTREGIIREAAAAVRTVGPRELGVADVMAKLGLTHGGFYAHFRTKDDLVAAAIAHMVDDQFERLYGPLSKVDPNKALSAIVESYLSPAHRALIANGCPLSGLVSEVPRLPSPLQDAFSDATDRVVDEIAGHLRRMSVKKSKTVARSALAEMVGAMAMSRTIRDDRKAAAFLKDARTSARRRLGIAQEGNA